MDHVSQHLDYKPVSYNTFQVIMHCLYLSGVWISLEQREDSNLPAVYIVCNIFAKFVSGLHSHWILGAWQGACSTLTKVSSTPVYSNRAGVYVYVRVYIYIYIYIYNSFYIGVKTCRILTLYRNLPDHCNSNSVHAVVRNKTQTQGNCSIFATAQEKIPAGNVGGCTCAMFRGECWDATTYPESIHHHTASLGWPLFPTPHCEEFSHIYIYSTSSNHMHFCLEYGHKLTKKCNTLFTCSLLKMPDVFVLGVVKMPVSCTSSPPHSQQAPAPHQTRLPPWGDTLVSCHQ
jgi:hypothetical protein